MFSGYDRRSRGFYHHPRPDDLENPLPQEKRTNPRAVKKKQRNSISKDLTETPRIAHYRTILHLIPLPALPRL
jgi:hypothetical protein